MIRVAIIEYGLVLQGLAREWVMARHRDEEVHLMMPGELMQIRRELAVAIKQQQRINQQISEGRITLAQLSAAYLELQCLILVL